MALIARRVGEDSRPSSKCPFYNATFPEECFATDINGVRDLLSKFITVREEDLVMTGRTFGEYLEEEGEG